MNQTILVTGGCGYIGSHVVRQLTESGFKVIVIDNLSTGFKDSLLHCEPLYVRDLTRFDEIKPVFDQFRIDAIMDFAASIVVPESVSNPLDYYNNNLVSLINLLKLAKAYNVKNFIFSSTAAVYGQNSNLLVKETDPLSPENPYGFSKLFGEQMIQDAAKAYGLSYTILRYFNVAGADPKNQIGQRFPNATHLIKVACEVAIGKKSKIQVFGTDYKTKDGTGVRDYIHVEDLASAHLEALIRLFSGAKSEIFNCGYGKGYSVLEVLEALKSITSNHINVEFGPRRPGDTDSLVADTSKFRNHFINFKPRFENLKTIITHALAWETKLKDKL